MTPQLGDPGKAAELLAQILAMPHVARFDFSILRDPLPMLYEWTAEVSGEKYGDRLQVFSPDNYTPAQGVVILLRFAVHTLEKLA